MANTPQLCALLALRGDLPVNSSSRLRVWCGFDGATLIVVTGPGLCGYDYPAAEVCLSVNPTAGLPVETNIEFRNTTLRPERT